MREHLSLAAGDADDLCGPALDGSQHHRKLGLVHLPLGVPHPVITDEHNQVRREQRRNCALGQRQAVANTAIWMARARQLPGTPQRHRPRGKLGEQFETERIRQQPLVTSLRCSRDGRRRTLNACLDARLGRGQYELGDLLALALGIAPAASHRELLDGQMRPFEHRKLGLVRTPLAFPQLDPLLTRPRLDDRRVQLPLGQIEATEIVRKLTQLDVVSHKSILLPLRGGLSARHGVELAILQG